MSQTDFIPFIKPDLSSDAITKVVECLESGWLASGPRVIEFEKQLADFLEAPHVLTFTSGTAALFLALKVLDLQPGDEVILPSLTFVATANTIVHAGGVPVFVDIDETYNIDPNLIEAAITPRTKAIIPVHMAGLSPDLDAIYMLAEKHNVRVIEDAAQAIDGCYKNRKVGSFGDMQMFSFQATKNLPTIEGGCLVLRNEDEIKRLKQLRFHGIDRDAWDRFTKKGSQHYDVVVPGYKYNLPDLNAAVGLAQLTQRSASIEARNQMAARYFERLKTWDEITLPMIPNYASQPGWHLFMIQINPDVTGMDRDAFMAEMKEHNIGTGLHYLPVHLFAYYRQKFGYKPGMLPKTEAITSRILSLPFFVGLSAAEQNRTMDSMTKIFKRKG